MVPLLCFANKLGVMRAKMYCLPGGGARSLTAILTELQSLLVEHGHPAKEVDKKAHEIYDSLGHSLCKSVVDSKNPWAMLRAECTKNKVVLIPLSHRGATKGRDEVFESDPWANWGNGKPKNSRAKKVPNKQNNAVVKVDLSFFHEDRKPVTQIDLN